MAVGEQSKRAARGRVLIVDDEAEMAKLVTADLAHLGFAPTWRGSGEEAMQLLAAEEFDAVVTDLKMKGMSGIDFCERVVTNRPDVPVVVITAYGSMEAAVAAIRAGAYDFINKPFDTEELAFTLDRALQHRRLQDEVKRLRREVEELHSCDEMIGVSPPMKQVFELIERLRDATTTVLVTGETGTGKELVARALHRRSQRSGGPFVAINCAAVPEALLESQLFGHARGAFTDAREARTGLFVQASGGTLFLDEIGEMPLGLQPKILRALQDHVVRPLSSPAEVSFDARIIAASNRDLEEAVEQGRFRADLFFRVNVIHIHVPPLRARGGDILLLAQRFVDHFAGQTGKKVVGLTAEAADKLLAYSWPGNVRELQNAIERAVALTAFEKIVVEDLPEKVRSYHRSHVIVAGENPSELVPMEEVERRYILRVLEAVGGNKSTAAQILGFDRRTLYRKLERYGAG